MNIPKISATVEGLFIGKVTHRWKGRDPSAIHKTAASGLLNIDSNGFTDDAQADLKHHGGRDKAIHHYPADHYSVWIAEGEMPNGTLPAAFGENLTTHGLTELNLCIGDILRLGTAVVQISQGRQPCWKVSEYTANKRMAYLFQKTGRTGWYYRVLEHGQIRKGDHINLIERRQPDWTVQRVTAARLTRQVSSQDAHTLANLSDLAEGWRSAFEKLASGDFTENTSLRLIGQNNNI
ncbi:MOSC domain-containing protein [Roseovarius sp. EL26]|uniref:MOSC domain-containing protein n=1 Tax=Roseovarius sp. EL26 TaxID=2126672 RepID=UPI000EA3C016|nr:MOSC domain-containing protein [Roseovarius sp. EL26]